ncbi:MAG: helix-turn-helix domain-containing protein [Candidatus Brocadia sp.]|nr:helix-turn-helix domain-containing protein [Candidatus Brocadia sp.]
MTKHEVHRLGTIARQVAMRNEPHPLKKWMWLHRITSIALGKMSGISASAIRNLIRYKDPSKRTCIKLSIATGIPPEVLMFPERYGDYNVSLATKPVIVTGQPPMSPFSKGDF